MDQIVQLAGALFILSAFILAQMNGSSRSRPSTFCSTSSEPGLLSVVALIDRDWGFVLLEVVWTLVSGAGLARLARGQRRRAA